MGVTIREMKRRFIKAEKSLDSDIEVIIKLLEQQIIDLNREDQLFQGIGKDGNIIGVYSRATEEMTQGVQGVGFPKRAGEPFNFYNTGSMFKNFHIDYKQSRLSIFTSSESFEKVKEKYGSENVLGLTIENTEKLNFKMIRPLLVDFIKRHKNGY